MHRLVDYSYIFLTIIFTVYGQVVMKWRMEDLSIELPSGFAEKLLVLVKLLFDPYIFSGLFLAFFASLAWMAAMTKFELSFAYPFMALNFVLVFFLSALFLGESVSVSKFVGVLLIVVGTVIIARG